LSRELAQVTLCPETKNCNLKEKEVVKNLFKKAMEELNSIWNKTQYGSHKVISKSIETESCESPFSDYEVSKRFF